MMDVPSYPPDGSGRPNSLPTVGATSTVDTGVPETPRPTTGSPPATSTGTGAAPAGDTTRAPACGECTDSTPGTLLITDSRCFDATARSDAGPAQESTSAPPFREMATLPLSNGSASTWHC